MRASPQPPSSSLAAGVIGPIWETDPEDWWRELKVNLRGPLLCARAVLPDGRTTVADLGAWQTYSDGLPCRWLRTAAI